MTKLEQFDNTPIAAADFEAPTGQQARAAFRISRNHWLLFGLGLFCLLFIAFITFSRSVQVTAITPVLGPKVAGQPDTFVTQAASVDLQARVKLPLGNRVLVMPGAHKVRVTADGFTPLEQTLEVGSDRHQQFELVLTRLPGQLQINLNEDIAAQVLIDGETAGNVPGLIENIAAGEHRITVDAPLYRPTTKTVTIEGKGQTQTLDLALEPAWSEYSFSSVPAGASVLIDGLEVGKTPLVAKLEEGQRALQIQAQGFKPFEQELGVVAQQNLTIPEVALIPADGVLDLSSQPSNAAVILNGQYRGNTPIKLNVAPDQGQRLQVFKAGYRLVEQQVSLSPDQIQSEQFALAQDLVNVRVSVSPADAQVFVDGVNRGAGSQTLNLNTLPHTISVRKPGYVTQSNEIVPTRANQQIVSVNLLTNEQHYWAQIPDTYTNKSGHSMKLFKTVGTVKMGSSRREAGRRANEAVYTATLTKPFYVSLHETTNKQFRRFRATHTAGNYKKKSLDANKAPAVNISWQQAALYCNWLSEKEGLDPFYQTKSGFVSGSNNDANGYRLLTEAEWAWLARNKGPDVLIYPWGNTPKITGAKPVGNFADVKAAELIAFSLPDYDDGFRGSAPVGRFPPNHRGLFDMGGNVSEWVNDWYSARGSSELKGTDGLVDPLGPEIGEFHVVRGGSWAKGHLPQLRLAYRDFSAKGKHDIGFRIARYAGLNKGDQ